ncbi:MAG TPA: hypothetical protein VGI72_07970 [Gaiellales bacterium]|jgi:hypothetical protein
MIRRSALVGIVVVAAVLAAAASAAAYWSAGGSGQGLAATGSVGAVTGVDTAVHGTVASTSIAIMWSPVATGVPTTYVVERRAGATTVVCTTAATTCSASGLPDGSAKYSVTAEVNGWAGAPSTLTQAVKVSSAAPAVTASPASPSAATAPTIDFSHPVFAAFRCTLDGAGPVLCSPPVAVATLGDGQHTFAVAALDAYGAPTQVATVTWAVRTDAPAITAAPPVTTAQKTASFVFSHPSYGSFRCKLDGAGWGACTSPTAYSGLAAGAHTFRVEALDGDGIATGVTTSTWMIT